MTNTKAESLIGDNVVITKGVISLAAASISNTFEFVIQKSNKVVMKTPKVNFDTTSFNISCTTCSVNLTDFKSGSSLITNTKFALK